MTTSSSDGGSAFHSLLRDQIRREFTASHQYLAIAIYFDSNDFTQLAQRFYRQATEERSHALMMVQYLLDRGLDIEIESVDSVVTRFESVREPVELALAQEKAVTEQITELTRAARDTNDFLGERFMQWFLQEQVEEVASMSTLLSVVDKAAGNMFDLEAYVARELMGAAQADPTAPKPAGGAA